MRLIFAAGLTFISLNVWASANLNQKVTFSAHAKMTSEVIKEIATQTKIKFIVSPKLNLTKKLSLDVKDANMKDVLDFIVSEQNVTWKMIGDNSIKISAIH